MIARFKKNSYQWSPLAVILIIMLGCVSLPDAEHKEAVVTSAAKPSPATKLTGPTYRLAFDSKIAGMPVKEGYWHQNLDFSPRGDRIVFESQGKLYIADETGTLIAFPDRSEVSGHFGFLRLFRPQPAGSKSRL